jgi:hypothetical protein
MPVFTRHNQRIRKEWRPIFQNGEEDMEKSGRQSNPGILTEEFISLV